MEIKTCEEYVLAELSDARMNLEAAHKEKRQLEEEITSLNKMLTSIEENKNRPIMKQIVKFGRTSLLQKVVWATTSVIEFNRVLSFDEWIEQSVYEPFLPSEVAIKEFIAEFEPELRERYECLLAEETDSESSSSVASR